MNYLLHGDCLDLLKRVPDASVDFVLTDPPYGKIEPWHCRWDVPIPFDLMWKELNRIIKPNGAIALFATEPFASYLRISNIQQYKYDWIWQKSRASGFQHAKNKPMQSTENICIFSNANIGHKSILGEKRMEYNPQGVEEGGIRKITPNKHGTILGNRKNQEGNEYMAFTGFPNNILKFPSVGPKVLIHPTEKPVPLLEYLIKTYSNENETVLDFTAGSFSTIVAAINTNRNFIGIEKDDNYYNAGKDRVLKHLEQSGKNLEFSLKI